MASERVMMARTSHASVEQLDLGSEVDHVIMMHE